MKTGKKNLGLTLLVVLCVASLACTACSDLYHDYMGAKGLTDLNITFNANGGTGSMDKAKARKAAIVTLPENRFSKKDYSFAGWATSSSAVESIYSDGDSFTMGDTDVTLYAVWKTGYTISYNANGGTGSMSNQYVTAGSSATLQANVFTRSGYYFAGWATSASSTYVSYKDKDRITPTRSMTLYAVWQTLDVPMISVWGGTTTLNGTSVTLTGFSIGKTEITQAQYSAVIGSIPGWCSSSYGLGNDYPVYGVSWYGAIVFCNKLSVLKGKTPVYSLSGSTDPDTWGAVPSTANGSWDAVTMNVSANGYRLPTEAEWEYAAKGGILSSGYAYSGSDTLEAVGWYEANGNGMTHPVADKDANELGIYDMSGNVSEYCWDWQSLLYPSSSTNPTGETSGDHRVCRGGSWYNSAVVCAVTYRSYIEAYSTYYSVGFRVVCR